MQQRIHSGIERLGKERPNDVIQLNTLQRTGDADLRF